MKSLVLISTGLFAVVVAVAVRAVTRPEPPSASPVHEPTSATAAGATLELRGHRDVDPHRDPIPEGSPSDETQRADEVARLEAQVAGLRHRVALAEQAAIDADLELLRCRLGDDALLTRYVASDEYTEEGRRWIERLAVTMPSLKLLPGEATWIVEHAEEWQRDLHFEERAIEYLGPDRVLAALTPTEVIELIDDHYKLAEFEQVFGADWQRRRPDVELPDWIGMWD